MRVPSNARRVCPVVLPFGLTTAWDAIRTDLFSIGGAVPSIRFDRDAQTALLNPGVYQTRIKAYSLG
jgi:hypothetical protein